MGDWKNDRAEGEMREAGKKMVKEAQERAKNEEDQKWEDLKGEIFDQDSENGEEFFHHMNKTINTLRELGYDLPEKK
ncbi:MAG: hypothetical protein SLAVMIC_01044 [uncultured marine phage]|uniref:Uncharacterized protein n=1 Tax=uncultured marine phage TaxID=707152 RepID=A0A8D9CE17_9VIRU|nr:MAG: hypothetical protein SLAVMIC_01044 [uncultured marine phage]